MHANITLLDGVERNKQHPLTFEIPTVDEKAAVKPGDFVKIGFEMYGRGERMWVEVTESGKGLLNNDPVLMPMVCGEPVEFESKHILSIMKPSAPKGELGVVDLCQSCN